MKLDDDDIYIVDLPKNPIPNDPSRPRIKGHVNYGIAKDRFEND